MTLALWQRLKQLVHNLGWRVSALYAVHGLLQRAPVRSGLVCYRFLVQPVLLHARLGPSRGQHYALRLLSHVEPVLAALDRPPAVIAQRFADGAQCLLATRGQNLAGCIWFVRGTHHEDEVRVDYVLKPDCVWDFDVYVAPPERMTCLFARQWDELHTLLRQSGIACSLSRVNLLNRQSLAAHRRMGAIDNGWAIFLCIGSRQLMLSSLRPFVGVGGRPRLHMGAN